jgi:hypothetical protein
VTQEGAKFHRATVNRNIMPILLPVGYWRKVQILVPASPDIFGEIFDLTAGHKLGHLVIDRPELVPQYYGHNRSYKLSPIYPIANKFKVAPNHCIVAASSTSFAVIQIITEPTHPPRLE